MMDASVATLNSKRAYQEKVFMSHTLELTDEQFATLEAVAARSGQTPKHLVDQWLRALAASQSAIYYSTDEMFEALDSYAAQSDASQPGQEVSQLEQRNE
jgi:hypothetical protein